MKFDRTFFETIVKSVILLSMLAACGQTTGCSGCEPGAESFPAKDRINNAVQLRVTRSGLNFLEENLENVLAAALPEDGLNICLPGDEGETIGIEYGFCNQEMCGDGELGCQLNIAIGAVDIEVEAPNIVRANVEFEALEAEIPIAVDPIARCSISINGEGFNVGLPLTLNTPDPDRLLSVELGDELEYRLSDIDIRLNGEGGALGWVCDGVSFVVNLPFLRDVIFDSIQGFIDGLLTEQMRGVVEGFTCLACVENQDCPVNLGAQCVGGICRFEGGQCVATPLGIDGQADIGALLSSVTPGLQAILQYFIAAGGYAEVENAGISIGMIGGALSERNRCVPRILQPEIIDPVPSDLLRGNLDLEERDYHLGIGITKTIAEHFAWAIFNAGTLCVELTNETVEQLNAGILSIVLPGLADLAGNPEAPVAISLAPQQVPEVTFGANLFELNEEGERVLVEPALSIRIPELWMDFHVFMDDRWVRIFSLHSTVEVPLGLEFTPDNEIIPIIGDLAESLTDLRTRNAGIMQDDPELLATLLPALLNVFLGDLVGGVIEPIALPDLLGFRLDMSDRAVLAIENGEMLAIFARLGVNDVVPEPGPEEVETAIMSARFEAIPTDAFRAMGPLTYKQIPLRVVLDAWGAHDDETEYEYSWRINGSTWSPFQPKNEFTITHPMLLLQGKHTLAVRARVVGQYLTLDSTPAEETLIIDTVAPSIVLDEVNGRVRVEVFDHVSAEDDMNLEYRFDDGDWLPLYTREIERNPEQTLDVRVRDEAGLTSNARLESRRSPLIGRLPPNAREQAEDGGCGCEHGAPSTPTSLLLFAGLLFLAPRRRKTPWVILGVLAVLIGVGCDDDSGASRDRDVDMGNDMGNEMSMSGTVCDLNNPCKEDNHFCVEGECQLVSCQDDTGACGLFNCPDGEAVCNDRGLCECTPFCPEGCTEGTYCCQASNACVPLPDECLNLECGVGQTERIVFEGEGNPLICGDDRFVCECLDTQPAPQGVIGRYSDLSVVDGVAWISAYSDTYGDLVIGRFVPGEDLDWQWVDGLPEGVEPDANPTGPRGGFTLPGTDVGRYTSIVATGNGDLHVAYYDVDNGALKYAFGERDGDRHTWETLTLDGDGDAGRWASLALDAELRPGIAYRVGSDEGISQVRYIQATEQRPIDNANWGVPAILHARPLLDPDPETGTYPEGTGLFISQVRNEDGVAVVAWYDRTEGQMLWSRMIEAGFEEPQILAGWDHPNPELNGDMGANVDIAIDALGDFHLCFQDGLTDSLRYMSPGIDRQEWVDDGVWLDVGGRAHSVHVVGDDCNMLIDGQQNPVIVYQDATLQALLMRRRNRLDQNEELAWGRRQALRGDSDRYMGAFGFYTSAQVRQDRLWISHFVYRNHVSPPASGLEVLVVNLPE